MQRFNFIWTELRGAGPARVGPKTSCVVFPFFEYEQKPDLNRLIWMERVDGSE